MHVEPPEPLTEERSLDIGRCQLHRGTAEREAVDEPIEPRVVLFDAHYRILTQYDSVTAAPERTMPGAVVSRSTAACTGTIANA